MSCESVKTGLNIDLFRIMLEAACFSWCDTKIWVINKKRKEAVERMKSAWVDFLFKFARLDKDE